MSSTGKVAGPFLGFSSAVREQAPFKYPLFRQLKSDSPMRSRLNTDNAISAVKRIACVSKPRRAGFDSLLLHFNITAGFNKSAANRIIVAMTPSRLVSELGSRRLVVEFHTRHNSVDLGGS